MQTLLIAATMILSNNASVKAVSAEVTAAYKSHANHLSAECVDSLVDELELGKHKVAK